jgi:hypothetical protein
LGLTPGEPGFGAGGLAAMLRTPGIQVIVLPADVLATDIDFGDELLGEVLPQRFDGATANVVSLLPALRRSDGAAYRYSADSSNRVRAYVALRRNGGIEAGIAGGAAHYQPRDGGPRIYRLFVLVHLARQALAAQSRLVAQSASRQPYQIVMAVPGGGAALLGGYAEGWEQPEHMFDDEAPTAEANDPLIELEVDEWPPDDAGQDELLERFCERISDAFNDGQRRFRAAPNTEGAGTIKPSYA